MKRLAAALDGVAGRPGVDPMACFKQYFSEAAEQARKSLSRSEHPSELLRLSLTANIVEAILRVGANVGETAGQ